MRKWRPHHRCLYVIPEVHGALDSLNTIFNRILPIRFHNSEYDKIIMLGDFVDKGQYPAQTLQLIIDQKHKYGDNLICIKGNHEHLMLDALRSEKHYNYWRSLLGGMTTVNSYIEYVGLKIDTPMHLPYTRFIDIVPREHIEFLQQLPHHFIIDNYLFFHGGLHAEGIEHTTDTCFMFDTQLSKTVKQQIKNKEKPLYNSKYIYVSSHNYNSDIPFIYSKYFMLGGGAPSKLILFELNSLQCAMIKADKSRIYKHKFKYFE